MRFEVMALVNIKVMVIVMMEILDTIHHLRLRSPLLFCGFFDVSDGQCPEFSA
jgi:hypothetical protein